MTQEKKNGIYKMIGAILAIIGLIFSAVVFFIGFEGRFYDRIDQTEQVLQEGIYSLEDQFYRDLNEHIYGHDHYPYSDGKVVEGHMEAILDAINRLEDRIKCQEVNYGTFEER